METFKMVRKPIMGGGGGGGRKLVGLLMGNYERNIVKGIGVFWLHCTT